MWSRSTRYDFYFPAFAMLGEQAILNKEIYARGTATDNAVWGYQERWGEYRYNPSMITGLFRSTTRTTSTSGTLAQEFAVPAHTRRNFHTGRTTAGPRDRGRSRSSRTAAHHRHLHKLQSGTTHAHVQRARTHRPLLNETIHRRNTMDRKIHRLRPRTRPHKLSIFGDIIGAVAGFLGGERRNEAAEDAANAQNGVSRTHVLDCPSTRSSRPQSSGTQSNAQRKIRQRSEHTARKHGTSRRQRRQRRQHRTCRSTQQSHNRETRSRYTGRGTKTQKPAQHRNATPTPEPCSPFKTS